VKIFIREQPDLLRRFLLNHTEITNKMQPCTRIYYSKVYQLLNMFRATHRSSSGAQKL